MPVNLVKGQKVELRKEGGGTLRRIIVGLGWEESNPIGRRLISSAAQDVDCDASAFLCIGGNLSDFSDVVYFSNLVHKSDAVRHRGDNRTGGAGDNDDEQIYVDLESLPPQYDKIVFVANIYQADFRHQDFGMLHKAFIRVVDADTGTELCRYNLAEDYPGQTAIVFGELYQHDGAWKFNAIGQGTKASTVNELARLFSAK